MKPSAKIQSSEYFEMFKKAKAGAINQKTWFEYCQKILAKSLEENKNVLQKLKAP